AKVTSVGAVALQEGPGFLVGGEIGPFAGALAAYGEMSRPASSPIAQLLDFLRLDAMSGEQVERALRAGRAGAEDADGEAKLFLHARAQVLQLAGPGHVARLADERGRGLQSFDHAQAVAGRSRRVARSGTGEQLLARGAERR